MKNFREILMKDLGWKFLSVVIATIAWFLVININQPMDVRTYYQRVTIENLNTLTNRGLAISEVEDLLDTKVSIKIEAQRTALDRLSNSLDWLSVSLDLSPLTNAMVGDTISLPLEVQIKGVSTNGATYNVLEQNPSMLSVKVEDLMTQSFPIEITVEGDLPEGTFFSAPQLSQETVIVEGGRSAIQKVQTIKGSVLGEDVEMDMVLKSTLFAYGEDGQLIQDVVIYPTEIDVSFFNISTKQVPIQMKVSGTPAVGYDVGDVTITPNMITIQGQTDMMKEINMIQLPTIDITDESSTLIGNLNVTNLLPQGVSLASGEKEIIKVEVPFIGNETIIYTIPSTQLQLIAQEEGKLYELARSVVVEVEGKKTDLNVLDITSITGTVHVGGLEIGEHMALVSLSVPDRLSVDIGQILVTVTEDPAFVEVMDFLEEGEE